MIKQHEKLEDYRLHERVGYQMSRLTRHMQTVLEAGFGKHGISRMQWCVLSGVEIEKHCSPSELAVHIGVSRPSISRLLKQMETEQLIERDLIGDDGRTRLLSVTDKGREKLELCWEYLKETERHFLAKLTDQQIANLYDVVQTLMEGEETALEHL